MDNSSLIGSTLGKYQIQSEIGRGGMGAVYMGYDPALDRHVAIKILAPHLMWQEGFVERFLREARAAARLQHPNIVTIYDVGQEGGWYYYVMEYLEGQTVTQLSQKERPLPPKTTVTILRPLADALDYAHHNGLVHRDIKPGNIVVGRAGRVSLTDFGIARAAQETRLTATGTTVGTPEYMSPEQVRGMSVDARSDQYSLAVVAYEMLSGQVPFQADSTLALMYKVVHDPPLPIRQAQPDLPEQVEQVLGQALAKEPGDRYPTVTAFADDLERALAGQKVKAVPVAPPSPPKRAPTTPTAETAAAVGAAATTGAAAARRQRTPTSTPTAKPARPTAPPTRPTKERRRVPIWIWLLAALTVVVLAIALVMALGGGDGEATPTAVVLIVTPVPPEPTATEQIEPTATQMVVPSATAALTEAPEPTSAGTATPEPTSPPTQTPVETTTTAATATPAPTATPTASQTVQPTSTPTRRAPTPTRAPTEPPAQQFRAPNLLAPANGQRFAFGDPILLEWESVGDLPADGYYEVVVEYSPASDPSQTWTDETPWVKERRWMLSEHDYLPGLSADGLFRWAVRVMRKTGQDAEGRPTGTALSPVSGLRTLIWEAPPQPGGGNGGGAPTSPPP